MLRRRLLAEFLTSLQTGHELLSRIQLEMILMSSDHQEFKIGAACVLLMFYYVEIHQFHEQAQVLSCTLIE